MERIKHLSSLEKISEKIENFKDNWNMPFNKSGIITRGNIVNLISGLTAAAMIYGGFIGYWIGKGEHIEEYEIIIKELSTQKYAKEYQNNWDSIINRLGEK